MRTDSLIIILPSSLHFLLFYIVHCKLLQVPLGVLLKRETKHEDMIDIMASLQQYVPVVQYITDEKIQSTGEEVEVCMHT